MITPLAAGCSNRLRPDPGIDSQDSDTSDIDTSDLDSDWSGTDIDVDSTDLIDCRADYVTPAPGSTEAGGECTTDQVYCNEFIRATTEGGSMVYDTPEYLAAHVATGSEDWSGPERAYKFIQPRGTAVRMTFYSPCRSELGIAVCQGWECSDPLEIQSGDCSTLGVYNGDGGYYRDFPAPTSGDREWEIL